MKGENNDSNNMTPMVIMAESDACNIQFDIKPFIINMARISHHFGFLLFNGLQNEFIIFNRCFKMIIRLSLKSPLEEYQCNTI